MEQWLENLYKKNKIIFFLLIPLVILVIFKNLIFSFLARSVKGEVKNAIKKDDELKSTQDNLVKESEKHKALADAKKEEIKNNDAASVSEDWHKNRRPK
jgi:hypothetical protein